MQRSGKIIQQCAHGLVSVRISANNTLAFAVPDAGLTQFNDMPPNSALNSDELDSDLPIMVADMGIGWLLIPMKSASGTGGEQDSLTAAN